MLYFVVSLNQSNSYTELSKMNNGSVVLLIAFFMWNERYTYEIIGHVVSCLLLLIINFGGVEFQHNIGFLESTTYIFFINNITMNTLVSCSFSYHKILFLSAWHTQQSCWNSTIVVDTLQTLANPTLLTQQPCCNMLWISYHDMYDYTVHQCHDYKKIKHQLADDLISSQ